MGNLEQTSFDFGGNQGEKVRIKDISKKVIAGELLSEEETIIIREEIFRKRRAGEPLDEGEIMFESMEVAEDRDYQSRYR